MKVQAAICWEPGRPLEVDEVELAGPRAGECLVRLAATGVCHFCGETLTEGQKFCDSDCEEDYRRLQWQKSQRVRG